jgi:hypothetical protein
MAQARITGIRRSNLACQGSSRDDSRLTPEYGYGTLAVFSSGGYGGDGLAPTRFPAAGMDGGKKE